MSQRLFSIFAMLATRLAAESAVLAAAIHEIIVKDQRVTNKAIILRLIAVLEHSADPVEQTVLRHTLEIVVGITPDDEGF